MLHNLKIATSGITIDGYVVDYSCSSLREDQVIVFGLQYYGRLKTLG